MPKALSRGRTALLLLVLPLLGLATPSLFQEQPLAVVVRVEGDVELQREGADPELASVGARLGAGDRLVPAEDGRAVVVSRTGTRQEVTEAVQIRDPGPSEEGDLFDRTVRVLSRAASADSRNLANRQGMIRPIPGEPTPLAPRNGIAVMDVRPTFRWATVDGAEGYTVQLRREGAPPVRFQAGADTLWTLPSEVPPLLPGETYRWTIAPTGGRPAREESFVVADAETYAEVAGALGALREMEMDPAGDGLLLAAVVYLDSGLLYDAAAALDALESGGRVGVDFWLLQGEVMAGLGRLEEARSAFDRASGGRL